LWVQGLNMNYELARQLKECGFPQGEHTTLSIPRLEIQEVEGSYVKFPTLEELIDEFRGLTMYICIEQHSNDWRAGIYRPESEKIFCSASTPLEALANLYIKLHSKA